MLTTASGFSSAEAMNSKRYSVSAFFPAYNDVGSIGKIIHTMASLLPKFTNDYEVVVVDDGSTDGTQALLDVLARQYPFLKLIRHEVNRGYGATLITGFANCAKELIFYTDGDGQYDVEELSLLMRAFDEDVDIVNGYKISRSDAAHRIFLGWLYRHLIRLLFGLNVKDVDCDFRLFRRSVFDHTELTCNSGVICVEMMKKLQANGCRMVEIPVHHYHRISGSSQFFCFKHLHRVFVQLFAAWWSLVVLRKLRRSPDALPIAAREL